MNTGDLLTEIRAAFPMVAMPAEKDLRFHSDGCVQCRYLSEYLNERRGHIVDGPVIRYMHQEKSCLSAKGWAWALPHYNADEVFDNFPTPAHSAPRLLADFIRAHADRFRY
jgi:hypothetical protein